MPAYLWDSQTHQFRGSVALVIEKRTVQDVTTPLKEGQEIIVMKAIAGGNSIDFQVNKYGQ
jgi:hypothetical protein